MNNELAATTNMSVTQIQPTVRCGSVPFAEASCTAPIASAAIAVKAWIWIAGLALSKGARVTVAADILIDCTTFLPHVTSIQRLSGRVNLVVRPNRKSRGRRGQRALGQSELGPGQGH